MTPEIKSQIEQTATKSFNKAWQKGLTRRRKRSVLQWAKEVRKIKGGPISDAYADGQPIAFSTEYVPHTIAQMEAADDPTVRIIAIWGPRRDSKTTLALNAIGRCATDSPGGCYSVHPRINDATMFAENELEGMITNSPELNAKFVEKKSRDSGRTKDFKRFTGGYIRIISGESITAFRGTTVKVLHIPEADAANVESIYKAMGRTDGLRDAIIILESTGTNASTVNEDGKIEFHSVIAEHDHYGSQHRWFCACQKCGYLQTTKYEQIRTDTKDYADACYHCEKCDHAHTEPEWFKFAQEGKWYPTAGLSPEQQEDIANTYQLSRAIRPEIRSFWRNGFASLFPVGKGFTTKLHEFLANGEAAKSSTEALRVWTQEVACKLWDATPEAASPPPWKPMFDRRENYGLIVPEKAYFLTAFTDVHQNRLEVEWKAWGRNEESWGMCHRVLPGSVYQQDVWQTLRREMGRRFKHSLGCDIGLGFGLVDGGDFAEEVYRFFQELYKNPEPGVSGNLFASKGFGAHPHPIIDPVFRTVAKTLKGFHMGTWQAKKLFYEERFRMKPGWISDDQPVEREDARVGLMHWNMEYEQEYFEQCVREKPEVCYMKGDEVWKFQLKSHLRNEGLDLNVGNLAALKRWPRPWDLLEADLRERGKLAKGEAKPKAAVLEMQGGGGRDWMMGGMRW